MDRQLRLPIPRELDLGFDPERMRTRLRSMTVREVAKAVRWWCHAASPDEQRVLVGLAWPTAVQAARGRDRRRLFKRLADILAELDDPLVGSEGYFPGVDDLLRAADGYHEALQRPRRKRWAFELECRLSRGIVLSRLGFAQEAAQEFAKLRVLAVRRLSLEKRASLEYYLAMTLTWHQAGDALALDAFTRAVDSYRVLDDLDAVAECLHNKAEALGGAGRVREAIGVVLEARRTWVSLGDTSAVARADRTLAEIFLMTGDDRRLLGAATRAYTALHDAGFTSGAGAVLVDRARALDRLGRTRERDEAYRIAIDLAESPDPNTGSAPTRAVSVRFEYAKALVEGRRFASAFAAVTPAVEQLGSLRTLRGAEFGVAFDTIGPPREALMLERASPAAAGGAAPASRWALDDPRIALLVAQSLPVGDSPPPAGAKFLRTQSPRLLVLLGRPLAQN
jgi:tetratricopeptide (TPR) repeat protein